MILKDSFFTIINQDTSEDAVDFRIKLNSDHFVYKAHFPNNPITPGVLLIQIIIELFGSLKGQIFNLHTLKNIKFSAPINPIQFPAINFSLNYSLKENLYYVRAIIKENEAIFAKASIILK